MNKIRTINIRNLIIFFLLFFYPILPINYYIGPFNLANFCSILIVITFFILSKQYKLIKLQNSILFFWFFILCFSIQALFTQGVLSGVAYFVMYFLVPYIIINIVKDYKEFFKIIDMIIISGSILGVLGIVEAISKTYIFQEALLIAETGIRYGVLRSSVTFGHPINFGLFQSFVSILCFYRLNTSINSKLKKWYIISYIISVISLFLSVSRLAICMYLVVQLILLRQIGFKKLIKYLCFVCILIIILFSFSNILNFGISDLVNDFWISLLETIGLGNINQTSEAVVGFGNRFDLYKWVVDSIGDNIILGMGINAEFSYKMYDWFTKTSIEVQYLNIFYQFGLFGLIVLIFSYANSLKYFYKQMNVKSKYEKKITFTKVIFITFLVYYICLFGVQETDTTRIYCELIALGISYVRINYQNEINNGQLKLKNK